MRTLKEKLSKTTKIIFVAFALITNTALFVTPQVVSADTPPVSEGTHPCHPELDKFKGKPLGKPLSSSELKACEQCNQKSPTDTDLEKCLKGNPIINDLKTVVNILSAGVGVVIVGAIIVGGIQYVMAGNNPNAVSAAKQRIANALIALFAFIFIYAFLNWLLPGGVLFS